MIFVAVGLALHEWHEDKKALASRDLDSVSFFKNNIVLNCIGWNRFRPVAAHDARYLMEVVGIRIGTSISKKKSQFQCEFSNGFNLQ